MIFGKGDGDNQPIHCYYYDYQLPSLPKSSKAASQKRNEYHEIMSVVFMELTVLQKYGFQWTSKNLDGSR